MRKQHVILSLLLALAVCLCAADAMAISLRSLVKDREEETVTITREEYERLLRYEKLDVLMQLVENYYYEDVEENDMLEGAAVGLMAGIGDVYSAYYTAEQMAEFNEETEGEYAGIGCQLLADPSDQMITVTRVFKGSPAEKAGMRSGDKIVYVNDVYYSASKYEQF